jgi:hypothetical protein
MHDAACADALGTARALPYPHNHLGISRGRDRCRPLSHEHKAAFDFFALERRSVLRLLERIVSGRTKINQLHELLPWHWKAARKVTIVKAAA